MNEKYNLQMGNCNVLFFYKPWICQTLCISSSSSSFGFDAGGCSSVFFASESELAAAWALDLDDLVESNDLVDFFLRAWLGAPEEGSFVDESNLEVDFWLCRLVCLGMSDTSPVEELADWWRLDTLGASDCSSFEEFWVWWRLDGFERSGSPLELRRPETGEIYNTKWQHKITVTFWNCRHGWNATSWIIGRYVAMLQKSVGSTSSP